jgi:hypothetical protein
MVVSGRIELSCLIVRFRFGGNTPRRELHTTDISIRELVVLQNWT